MKYCKDCRYSWDAGFDTVRCRGPQTYEEDPVMGRRSTAPLCETERSLPFDAAAEEKHCGPDAYWYYEPDPPKVLRYKWPIFWCAVVVLLSILVLYLV